MRPFTHERHTIDRGILEILANFVRHVDVAEVVACLQYTSVAFRVV